MATAKYHATKSTTANTRSGYTCLCYLADKAQMDVIGEPTDPPATPGEKFVISTDHTFLVEVPTTGFYQAYTLPKRSEAAHSSSGEEGALSITYTHKVFFQGDSAALQAMLEELKNAELIMIVEDASGEASMIQYGSKRLSAHISAMSFVSGTQFDGVKGWEVTVIAVDRFFYTGTVTLAEE